MIALEYVEIDGLLYPNIETGLEYIENDLGKYGILRLRYLHEQKPEMFRELFLTGKLAKYCVDIDEVAFNFAEHIRSDYLKIHSMPMHDKIERICISTLAQNITDEIICQELIYRNIFMVK